MFVGTDYVLPRTAFMLMAEYERQQGLSLAETNAVYTPFGHVDYAHVVAEIAHLERGGKTAVIASLWGESSAAFHEELARRKLRTKVLHLSLEQFQIKTDAVRPYVGTLAARSYLTRPGLETSARFERQWRDHLSRNGAGLASDTPLEDLLEATHVGIRLWKLAVERAGSTEVAAVRKALPQVKLMGPMGVELAFDQNHFLARPLFLGTLRADGGYDVLWQSAGPLVPEPYSRYHRDNYQR